MMRARCMMAMRMAELNGEGEGSEVGGALRMCPPGPNPRLRRVTSAQGACTRQSQRAGQTAREASCKCLLQKAAAGGALAYSPRGLWASQLLTGRCVVVINPSDQFSVQLSVVGSKKGTGLETSTRPTPATQPPPNLLLLTHSRASPTHPSSSRVTRPRATPTPLKRRLTPTRR